MEPAGFGLYYRAMVLGQRKDTGTVLTLGDWEMLVVSRESRPDMIPTV